MWDDMFLHLSILCIDMDSFHFHNSNQSTGMYNHISTLHFLSYICHHSCREKIHKGLKLNQALVARISIKLIFMDNGFNDI